MAPKIWLIVVLLAMVMIVEPSSSFPLDGAQWGGMVSLLASADDDLPDLKMCNGTKDDCIDVEEELMLELKSSRKQLDAYSEMFISYEVLKKNVVPCSQPGASYYGCWGNKKANPYRRGCTAITHCKRYTK